MADDEKKGIKGKDIENMDEKKKKKDKEKTKQEPTNFEENVKKRTQFRPGDRED